MMIPQCSYVLVAFIFLLLLSASTVGSAGEIAPQACAVLCLASCYGFFRGTVARWCSIVNAVPPVPPANCISCPQACDYLCSHPSNIFHSACFANDTTVAVIAPDGSVLDKPISTVQVGDRALTLVGGQVVYTRVVSNVYSTGNFVFFDFEIRSDTAVYTLRVTSNHNMLIVDLMGDLRFTLPQDVTVGDKMQTSDGSVWEVSRIGHSQGDEKFTLVTTEGSVLASGLLVSTICQDQINGLKMEEVMPNWMHRHPFALPQTSTVNY